MRLEDLVQKSVLTEKDFTSAAAEWLEGHSQYVRESTIKSYRERIRVMSRFFGEMCLMDITVQDIRAYVKMRQLRAGASCINHEISLLEMMLKEIGRWEDIEPYYQPLPLPRKSPHRALTPQEEDRLYQVGMSNPAWEVAYCCTILTINTTCGAGELRFLRLMDVDEVERTIRVQPEGCKNEYRERVVPLNDTAWRAMEYLIDRAHKLGSTEPCHYLLPFRLKRGHYDPNRPMKGWRTAFREMAKAADLKISYYCLRHHSITRMLEQPITDKMVEAIAGHVSKRMLETYSHIRLEAKREVVRKLERIRPRGTGRNFHRKVQ